MLREAGLKAWPVLIPTQDTYNLNPDFQAVIFVTDRRGIERRLVFMDPTAELFFGDLPTGDQARRVLIFRPKAMRCRNASFSRRYQSARAGVEIFPQNNRYFGLRSHRRGVSQGQRTAAVHAAGYDQDASQRIQEIAWRGAGGYDISGLVTGSSGSPGYSFAAGLFIRGRFAYSPGWLTPTLL